MISAAYVEQNRQLHAQRLDFGNTGHKYASLVLELVDIYGTRDILDYGCGKRTLEMALGFPISNYDPCIAEFAQSPAPHRIVVCNDVLEHVEPEHIDAVLADIRRCTLTIAFLTIDMQKAEKTLPDGRNAHLIVQPAQWWLPKLWQAGFNIRGLTDSGRRLKVTAV